MSNRAAADHQGWVLGSASTALGLAWMITGFLSGLLISFYLSLPLEVAAGTMILALIVLYRSPMKMRDFTGSSVQRLGQ